MSNGIVQYKKSCAIIIKKQKGNPIFVLLNINTGKYGPSVTAAGEISVIVSATVEIHPYLKIGEFYGTCDVRKYQSQTLQERFFRLYNQAAVNASYYFCLRTSFLHK